MRFLESLLPSLLLATAFLAAPPARAGIDVDNPYARSDEALPQGEEGAVPQLRLMAGRGFASEGNHGGLYLGAVLSVGHGNLVGGVQCNRIAEVGAIMGIDPREPLESYTHAGGFLGHRIRGGKSEFTAGLGLGRLAGTRRGALLSETEDCESWAWFSDCPEEDVVIVRTYASEDVRTLSLNPLLALDVQVHSALALGFWAQAFLNPEQSLGSFALVLRFGR